MNNANVRCFYYQLYFLSLSIYLLLFLFLLLSPVMRRINDAIQIQCYELSTTTEIRDFVEIAVILDCNTVDDKRNDSFISLKIKFEEVAHERVQMMKLRFTILKLRTLIFQSCNNASHMEQRNHVSYSERDFHSSNNIYG